MLSNQHAIRNLTLTNLTKRVMCPKIPIDETEVLLIPRLLTDKLVDLSLRPNDIFGVLLRYH